MTVSRTTRLRVLYAVAAAAAIGVLGFAGLRVGVLHAYRLQASDALFPAGRTDPSIVVVAVDTASLEQVGTPWPWPRDAHAQLVRNLTAAGAHTIVYDIIFHPPADGDDELAAAIRDAGNVVLATLPFAHTTATRPVMQSSTAITPVDALAAASAGIAHAAVTPDPSDGVVRSLPLLVDAPDGELVAALSLAALQRVEGLSPPYTIRPTGVQVGERLIPTGRATVIDLAFTDELHPGHADAPVIPAADVLAGGVASDALRGKVVFVGVSDPALGDHRPTPTAKVGGMPGVLVHANALNTMLTGAWIRPVSTAETVAWVVALAVAFAVTAASTRTRWVLVAAVAGLAAYIVVVFLRFTTGVVMDLVYPPAALLAGVGAGLAIRSLTEQRERAWVTDLLAQYVPESVARSLVATDRLDAVLQGERVDVAVLFCDLRGFTATSATLDPSQVRELLNVYYEHASAIVLERNGTLMQFVGDEVFAVFGAPARLGDERERALECALALIDAQPAIVQHLAERGLPAIDYGIGLHYGPVVATHLGTERRRQYAVVGDTVNCGARLCSLAGAGQVVVSEDALAAGVPDDAQPLGKVTLKGVARDLHPYRIAPRERVRP